MMFVSSDLILEQRFFYFVLLVEERLAEYSITPCGIHDASTITKLVPETQNFGSLLT